MISLRPRSEHRAELDLTPFMDVIFILLIFFIIASAFAVRGLDLDLPSAQSSQALVDRSLALLAHYGLEDAQAIHETVPVTLQVKESTKQIG